MNRKKKMTGMHHNVGINRILQIAFWIFLTGALGLCILSEILDKNALGFAGALMLLIVFPIASIREIVRKQAYKHIPTLTILIVCAIAGIACLTMSIINTNRSIKIWEEVDVLKTQKSRYEYGSDEWEQLENKIELERNKAFDLSGQSRLLIIIFCCINVAGSLVIIKIRHEPESDDGPSQ